MTRSQAYRQQAKFHASLRAVAPAQLHAVGAQVKFDDVEAVVESFDADKVVHGNRGYYVVRVTGGVNIFGKPAQVGELRSVMHSNVRAA